MLLLVFDICILVFKYCIYIINFIIGCFADVDFVLLY